MVCWMSPGSREARCRSRIKKNCSMARAESQKRWVALRSCHGLPEVLVCGISIACSICSVRYSTSLHLRSP